MDAAVSSARQARAQHRHELRTLTYVTLDQSNGGIVRNLSQHGIGVQVVAAVRPQQQLRVRFELRYPRLQVETRAEVVWATFSGQCGIRFLDLSPVLKRQINEWILGDLLETISIHGEHSGSMFAPKGPERVPAEASDAEPTPSIAEEDDGLMVSAAPVKVIEMPITADREPPRVEANAAVIVTEPNPVPLDWLSQPLSGRTLAWTVDVLMVMASLLLFTLVFLSVTREAPPWPLATFAGASLVVGAIYWVFFRIFAGGSLGARLARIVVADQEASGKQARFR